MASTWVAAATIALLAVAALIPQGEAVGDPCKGTPVGLVIFGLSSCQDAAKNPNVKVPASCCKKVSDLINNKPGCLCRVINSQLAKLSGIKPANAITIPKRCNIHVKASDHKCGSLTIP